MSSGSPILFENILRESIFREDLFYAIRPCAPVPHQDRVDRGQDYVAPVGVHLERWGQVVSNLHLGYFGLPVQPFVRHLFGVDHVPRLLVLSADQVAADESAPVPANHNAAVVV